MPHTERTFTVTKPVKVVHDYLQDFGRAEMWDPGTQTCTRRDQGGPVRVGSTWDNVSKIAGKKTALTYTLERLEPGRITFVGKNKTATSTDDIVLQPSGDGTQITYTSDVVFNGLAKLTDPIFSVIFQRLGNQTQDNLVRIIERL
jgi:carbon monoxide dehydrogenase subunit G